MTDEEKTARTACILDGKDPDKMLVVGGYQNGEGQPGHDRPQWTLYTGVTVDE